MTEANKGPWVTDEMLVENYARPLDMNVLAGPSSQSRACESCDGYGVLDGLDACPTCTTLIDFLLARIAQDERQWDPPLFAKPGWLESRMLAECEAKRRIVELHQYDDLGNGEHSCAECDFGGYSRSWCPTLRALAAVYADHPDYRAEWRPAS